MKLPNCVMFDLDGTLVDTGPDIAAALNHALAGLGYPPLELDDVAGLVGHGARALIERGFEKQGMVKSPEEAKELMRAALPSFLTYYAANICNGSTPYPGVIGALDRLAEAGVILGVCTNKPEGLARGLFDALGWSHRFAAVIGGDRFGYRKPDPRHLLATIAEAGGDPARAVMVGDSSVDVEAARAAAVAAIAVNFGFSHVDSDSLNADAVIDHYDQLHDTLLGLASRQ